MSRDKYGLPQLYMYLKIKDRFTDKQENDNEHM